MYSIRTVDLTSVSPGANGASVEKGVSAKISQIFARASLYLKYIGCKINDSLAGSDRRRVFKDKIIVKCGNHGRGENIGKFVDPVTTEKLNETAKRHQVEIEDNSTFSLKPFSEGICFGASLVFSKKLLETNDIKSVAEEFKGSAPYDAALVHGYYERLQEKMKASISTSAISDEYFPMINSFIKKQNGCTPEEQYKRTTDEDAIKLHLEEFNLGNDSNASDLLIVTSGFLARNSKPNSILPLFIRTVVNRKLNFDKVQKAEDVMKDHMGLASSTTL
nr:hypothetical protein [Chlamydiota bacterium]